MNKIFSKTRILVNILIFLACAAAFPLIFLFGNGYILWIYIFVLITLSSCSVAVYSQKVKKQKTMAMPSAMSGAMPIAVEQKPNRKMVVLKSYAVICGFIEVFFVLATVSAFVNPGPGSIGVIFSLPASFVNGLILLILICVYVSQKKKNY